MGIVQALKTVQYNDKVVVVDDDLLKALQSHLLEMMKEIAGVMKKHSIRWCLSGGSVLGAIRHKGFIPWDDDIDIFMEREEYEKFRRIFKKELGYRYDLKVPGDRGYLFHFPQIQDRRTKIQSIQSATDECEGLFIDIFIYENTYNNAVLRTIHGIQSSIYLFIDSSVRMQMCRANILKFTNYDENVRKEVDARAKFSFLFRWRSLEKWLVKSEKCFSKVKKKGKYIVVPSGGNHFFGEVFLRKEMCRFAKVDFETERWYVPRGYKYYLNARYPGYEVIPSEKDRERHIYAKLELGE